MQHQAAMDAALAGQVAPALLQASPAPTLSLPAAISAVISSQAIASGTAELAVTPLTNLAAQQLRAASVAAGGAQPNALAATNANIIIAQAFGLSSITALPPTVNGSTTSISNPYALVLASIAEAAAASGQNPFAFVSALIGASPDAIDTAQAAIAAGVAEIASKFTVPADVVTATQNAVENASTDTAVPLLSGT